MTGKLDLDAPFLRDLECVLRRHGRKLDLTYVDGDTVVGWGWHTWAASDDLVCDAEGIRIVCGDCGYPSGKEHHPLCCWSHEEVA